MSGGSFNYLCHRSSSDIFSDDSLRDMAVELEELGYVARVAAERTRGLLALQDEIAKEIAALSPVWHAVEWWRSCDWSRDQVLVEIGKWLEREKP